MDDALSVPGAHMGIPDDQYAYPMTKTNVRV